MTTNLSESAVRIFRPLNVHVAGGTLLVEHRHATEVCTVPFCFVRFEFWIHGFEEGAHEGDLERRAGNGSFAVDVHHYEESNPSALERSIERKQKGEEQQKTHIDRTR